MACKVSVSAEVLVEEKDKKGDIVGTKYEKRTKVAKNELIRVAAKMTDTCKAKIRIQSMPDIGPSSFMAIESTPGTPDGETCTKYKEVTYWVTQVNRGGDTKVPKIKFTATANCGECGCEDETKQVTDTCELQVTGG